MDPVRKFKLAQSFKIIKRKQVYYDPETKTPVDPPEENALCFEKPLSNIFELTEKIKLLLVNRIEEFAPIIYEQGVCSKNDAVQALSSLHKKWLDISGIIFIYIYLKKYIFLYFLLKIN